MVKYRFQVITPQGLFESKIDEASNSEFETFKTDRIKNNDKTTQYHFQNDNGDLILIPEEVIKISVVKIKIVSKHVEFEV